MKPEGYVHGMTDKPVATVHGTGSACDQHDALARELPPTKDWIVPTPPASPTVVLDRKTFDKTIRALEKSKGMFCDCNGDGTGLCQMCSCGEALALLRAAERQQ